jgi:AcrR family transcriptional regulator
MIPARGNADITLVDVARQAGLSRQTLYLLFGSRAGLLLAMVEHMDKRSQVGERFSRAREVSRPREAFEPYVRAWLEYLPKVFPVARALQAAATLGDREAAAAWESRMALLRGGFQHVARQLRDLGLLRGGWTAPAAADWMFSLSHIDTWQHLVVESGWKPGEAVEHIVTALRATLLRAG